MGSSKTKSTRAVEPKLSAVVKRIHDKCPDLIAGLLSLLNLSRQPVVQTATGLTFGHGTLVPRAVAMSADAATWVMAELVTKYHVTQPSEIQSFLRHQWSHFKPKADRQARGQYFTPSHVMEAIRPIVQKILDGSPGAVLLDPAAGGGALLSPFGGNRVVASDIDPVAVAMLQELGFAEVVKANSLSGACRDKFGLSSTDALVVVMNPPFNGDNQAQHDCDDEFKAIDSCVSFLKMAASLKPQAIVCIQPLTTLAKERNFAQLGEFAQSYALHDAFIMSSDEFALGGEGFPLVVACYQPGQMTFADIENFPFPIRRNVEGQLLDQGQRLQLSAVKTTKGLIRNMPPKKGVSRLSPLGIYQFNFRHINFVVAKGNLSESPSDSMIPVDNGNLWQYAYINCFKRHFQADFVVGNLDPLCRPSDFANPDFVDACIYDAIMANSHRMEVFRRGNVKSTLVTPTLLAEARRKATTFTGATINVHQAFTDWWDTGATKDALTPFFVPYFATLKAASLTQVPMATATPANTVTAI